jgi:hypothetical protein
MVENERKVSSHCLTVGVLGFWLIVSKVLNSLS